MPKQKAIALIGELHDKIADDTQSEQQRQLLQELETHIHELGEKEPPEPSFLDSVEVMLNDAELKHPAVAGVVKNLLDTLRNIGV